MHNSGIEGDGEEKQKGGKCPINILSSIPVDFKQIDQALKPGRDQFGLNQQAPLDERMERRLKNGEERSGLFVGRTDGWVDLKALDNCSCRG